MMQYKYVYFILGFVNGYLLSSLSSLFMALLLRINIILLLQKQFS